MKHVSDFRRRIKSGIRYHPKGTACFAKKSLKSFRVVQLICSHHLSMSGYGLLAGRKKNEKLA